MTGSTVPDGFMFETNSDAPGVSLRAEAGTTLAEQIQAKFAASDAAQASLADRVAALENGTGGAGWIPISEGTSSGASFTVDLTAGGKFPSPPSWTRINIFMRVDLSAVGNVHVRINGDSDAVYRHGSAMIDSEIPASFDSENWASSSSTSWAVGQMSMISTGVIDMDIFHAHAAPGLMSFQSRASRQSDDGTFHRHVLASGSLTAAKTATSLVFYPSGATTFETAWWRAIGLRMAHPS